MKLLHVGFNNYVPSNRIIAIVSYGSAPSKRMVQDAKDSRTVVEATHGRKIRSVIITDSKYIVTSMLDPSTLENRLIKGDIE